MNGSLFAKSFMRESQKVIRNVGKLSTYVVFVVSRSLKYSQGSTGGIVTLKSVKLSSIITLGEPKL